MKRQHLYTKGIHGDENNLKKNDVVEEKNRVSINTNT